MNESYTILPTPIARCLKRYNRASNERDAFDAFQYLFEAALKYVVIITIPIVKFYETNKGNEIEYMIAKSGSIGYWNNALSRLNGLAKAHMQESPWLKSFVEWNGSKKFKKENLKNLLNLIQATTGAECKIQYKKRHDLFTIFVWIRNRISGHGAPVVA